MDLLEQIREAIPLLPPDLAEEIIQDVAVLVLEGRIQSGELRKGIREHLTELRRKYPSLQFQISLDAPVNNSEGTTLTLGDVIQGAGRLAKRRGIGRKRRNSRPMDSAICKQCAQRFYFKRPGRKLKKKELQRVKLLAEINPKFWSKLDITLLRVADPDLLNRSGIGRTAKAGKFCSRECAAAFGRSCERKLPKPSGALEKQISEIGMWGVANRYGCTWEAVRAAALRHGIVDKQAHHVETCIEPGCERPPHKVRHGINGSLYGTRCLIHRREHYAKMAREKYRKDNKISEEKFRKPVNCKASKTCKRVIFKGGRCKFHHDLLAARRQRQYYRENNNIPPERWRVNDAAVTVEQAKSEGAPQHGEANE